MVANFKRVEEAGLMRFDTKKLEMAVHPSIFPPERKKRKNWIRNAQLYAAWRLGDDYNQKTQRLTVVSMDEEAVLGSVLDGRVSLH